MGTQNNPQTRNPELFPDSQPDNKEKVETQGISKINNSRVISLDLNETQKTKLISVITDEIDEIIKEYEEEGYYERIEACDKAVESYSNEYEDEIAGNASKRQLKLSLIMAEIVATSGRRQTTGAKPIMLLEPEEETDNSIIVKRQDFLDCKLRKDVKIDELDYYVYKYACTHPAAVVNVAFEGDTIEYIPRKTSYSSKNLDSFKKTYTSDLLNPESVPFQNLKQIESGEEVTISDIEEKVVSRGVKPYRVDYKKFFARLSTKDINRQRVVAEELDYKWVDIQRLANNGYFTQDCITELKEKYKDDYFKRDYCIVRAVIYMNLKEEISVDDDGLIDKLMRYVVYYDDDSRILLKGLFYPYEHNKVFYVVYNGMPKDDSWFGDSFTERTKDTKEIAEAFLNSVINEFNIAHTRTVMCDDPQFKPERVDLVEDDINVIKFNKGTVFSQIKFDTVGYERVSLLNWINNFEALITGVDPMLASGAQTPDDPRAPASKTAIKKQSSNIRIEDIIITLQKADAELAEQVESIYFQYYADDNGTIKYFDGKTTFELNRDMLSVPVRYVCHGSSLSFSKALDQQLALYTTDYVSKYYPEVWQDIEARRTILGIYLQNAGGSVEKNKDAILKPLDRQLEAKKAMLKVIDQLRQKGYSKQQIDEYIQQIQGGGQGQQQPAQPQGAMPI